MIAFFQKGAIFDFDYFSNKNCDRNCYKNLFVIVGGHLFPVPCLQKYDFKAGSPKWIFLQVYQWYIMVYQ